jgi:hypothetical protein
MKRIEKVTFAIMTGLALVLLIGILTSCVSKHQKCAAYDKDKTHECCGESK